MRTLNGTTTGRQDNALQLRQVTDDLFFPFAEALFAFNIKYPGDISSCPTLDLNIRVIELHVQLICEVFTDSALTCPHGAHKENIAFFSHFIRQ